MIDVFDRIAPDAPDVFDRITAGTSDVFDRISLRTAGVIDGAGKSIDADMRSMIKEEVGKIKTVQNVIERVIEKQVIKNIPVDRAVPVIQTVKEIIKEKPIYHVIEKVKEGKRNLVEEKEIVEIRKSLDGCKSKIAALSEDLAQTKEILPMLGGSGVIGIPAPEGNESKVLTVKNGKAAWQTASGAGSSSDSYAPTNVTTTRSFDCNSYTMDTIANVVGSLIASLKGAGIIQ